MKKLILSCTMACFSLLGKRGIVDAYNNIPTKPQPNNLLHTVSTPTNATTPSIDALEGITPAIPNTNSIALTEPNLIDVVTVTDVAPKLNLLNVIPLNDVLSNDNTLPVVNITSIPNIIGESPVLVVANELPIDSSIVENLITDALKSTELHKVSCYKIVSSADKTTQYIFAPTYTSKNPLTNIYEAIFELVSSLAAKLQELLGGNTEQVTLDTINQTPAEYTE